MAVTYRRQFERLGEGTYDLLVIGGGIIGLATAYDAAQRGLRVALVERADFGGASSQGCYKIIHGGLRYLQHLHFERLFSSVREQRNLRKLAPHLTQPLPILVPCYGYGMKGREVLSLGNLFYEALAMDRNAGVDPALHLPRHRLLTTEQCLVAAPQLNPKGLRGGVVFFDAQMTSSERLSLAFAFSAINSGALLCNYAEANAASVRNDADARTINSVGIRCLRAGATVQCQARQVVNASGPWAPLVASVLDERSHVRPEKLLTSEGLQVVFPQLVRGFTVAIESQEDAHDTVVSRGARSFFLMPWRGRTVLGTSDVPFRGDPTDFQYREAAVREFVASARSAYNHPDLSLDKAQYVFGGVRPIDENDFWEGDHFSGEGRVTVSKKNIIVDHAEPRQGGQVVANLISVSGIKYTTCRDVAERVVDLVCRKLGRLLPCRSADVPLVGGQISSLGDFIGEQSAAAQGLLSERTVRHLVSHFGEQTAEIIELCRAQPDLAAPLSLQTEVIGAEIVFAAQHEMPETFADIVFRRTGLGTLGHPGEAALLFAARLAGQTLGWNDARAAAETEAVRLQLTAGLPIVDAIAGP